MPPKRGEEDEQKLQALLLADSFTRTFRPVTLERPKVLCPLACVPMLDYTIEFLAAAGVQELFIVCANKAERVKQHVRRTQFPSSISVECVTTHGGTAGDALREVDNMAIINSEPFILISGDVISNMNLKKAIELHLINRKLDPECAMTKVLKEAGANPSLRSPAHDLVITMDAETRRITHWQDDVEADTVTLSPELLAEQRGRDFETRYDLLDCGIDICSYEVLGAFSDNWDYQNLRGDFCRTEVGNIELGKRIYAHVLPHNEYAAKVEDFRTYAHITADVVKRCVHPFAPDNNFYGGVAFRSQRYNCYREDGTDVDRAAHVGEDTVLSRGVKIGPNSRVERCVLGRNCVIGENVHLTDCILWGDVTVEDGVSAECSILCDRVVVHANAIVPRGCVISIGCVVDEGMALPPFARVTRRPHDSLHDDDDDTDDDDSGGDFDEDEQNDEFDGGGDFGNRPPSPVASPLSAASNRTTFTDPTIVGDDGIGRLWSPNEEDDDSDEDDDDEGEVSVFDALTRMGFDAMKRESWGAHEVDEWLAGLHNEFPPDLDDLGEDPVLERSGMDPLSDIQDFMNTVSDMIQDCVHGLGDDDVAGADFSDLLMEVKSLKFSQNKDWEDCLAGFAQGLLVLAGTKAVAAGAAGEAVDAASRNAAIMELRRLAIPMAPMGRKMVQSEADELGVIKAVEAFALSTAPEIWAPQFRFALQIFLQAELLTDDGLLLWVTMRRTGAQDAPEAELFNKPDTQAFVDWLEESDDESESGDDSESDSEDGSDSDAD
eukprot:CAMPEP_0118868664 /NCGR_PEP_ID=MMETSP1163-20130328/12142_1 /TAXON_ID=124430 /ORGANISM="Phaeomonas parva, Strain CCMP2877" /LENGTH=775 /DNA_ID=CAMNT_0006803407 /DNA_START=60 /DNA_END=2387 /DNA_ORIENTATION=-